MSVAEQDKIVHVGRAALSPVHEVVRVGVGNGAIALRPFAAAGPSPERVSGGIAGEASGAADVDHRRLGSEKDPPDTSITCKTLHRGCGNRAGVLERNWAFIP
jgi:hypothetical protein